MIANLSHESPAASTVAGRRTAEQGLVGHVAAVLWSWWRTQGDRRRLYAMSDDMLRDLGLSRADVEREFQRPFWEPIDYRALDEQREIAARRGGFGLP
jgi:uncharacterized protein YjiS (DUF1127 family)